MFENSYNRGGAILRGDETVMSRELQDILIRHWLFSVLPGKVIADLSLQFTIKNYAKDQYVFHQDDQAKRLFILLDGEVSIETVNLDGKITKLIHLGAGEIFGEFALIDEEGRSASARIVRKSKIASLPGQVFHDLLSAYPEFSKKLLAVLVARLRGSNHQVESLVTLTLLQRTAQLLLQLSGSSNSVIKTTQNDLSERLFATREKVNTKLKELERMGAIETGHSKITVKNPARLSALLELE